MSRYVSNIDERKRRAVHKLPPLGTQTVTLQLQMLRNILIISSGGIVLFSKEYANGVAQPRLVGGLITAMLDSAIQRTGAPVAYVELQNIAVSIVCNVEAKLTCALFTDKNAGYQFGRLLARELLYTFIQNYCTTTPKALNTSTTLQNTPHVGHKSSMLAVQIKPHPTTPPNQSNQLGIIEEVPIIDRKSSASPELLNRLGKSLPTGFHSKHEHMSRSCSVGSGAALGSGGMASLSEYANFSVLIPKVARQALRPVLEQLLEVYGIMHVVVLSTDRLLAFGSACVTLPPLASESVSNSAVVPEAPPQPKPAEKPRVVVHESDDDVSSTSCFACCAPAKPVKSSAKGSQKTDSVAEMTAIAPNESPTIQTSNTSHAVPQSELPMDIIQLCQQLESSKVALMRSTSQTVVLPGRRKDCCSVLIQVDIQTIMSVYMSVPTRLEAGLLSINEKSASSDKAIAAAVDLISKLRAVSSRIDV